MLIKVRSFEKVVGFKTYCDLLPHDGGHATTNDRKTAKDTLEENGRQNVKVVPKTGSVWLSISEVRAFCPLPSGMNGAGTG